MNGLAFAAALVLAQAPGPSDAPPEGAAPAGEASAAAPPTEDTPQPAAPPRRRRVEAAPPSPESLTPAAVTTTARRRAPGVSTATPTPTSTPTSTPTAKPTAKPTAPPTTAAPSAGSPPPPRPVPGAQDAEHAARAFLDALVRGDSSALAAIASDRFSFDGDMQSGRDGIRRTWRELLVGRPAGPQPAVRALELLEAEDAATRFGKPPARLAPLVRRGVTIAVADVGGRTVVLFLAREGGRMAVLGMHD